MSWNHSQKSQVQLHAVLYCSQAACTLAHAAHVPVWFEPVSVAKAVRATKVLGCLTYTSPNAQELIAMAAAIDPVLSTQTADKLLLQLAAGSNASAANQLHSLAPFVLAVLKVVWQGAAACKPYCGSSAGSSSCATHPQSPSSCQHHAL